MRRAWLLLIVVIALALRLAAGWQTFREGGIDGPDGWYHLRRAMMTMADWPHVPQVDPLLNAPRGGTISWPPLFDGLLATLALPLPFGPFDSLRYVGAFLPPLLGILEIVALYALVRRLRCSRAGLIAASVAAVLPGVVRYTLIGALDHDPFYELCNLVALIAVADEEAPQRRRIAILAAALTAAILGWTGAVVGVVIVTAATLASGSRGAARVLAYGSAVAAVAIAPFVMTSAWHGATFEGLSLLHEAVLVGACVVGAAFARERRLLVVAGIVALALLPIAVVPFVRGMRYAAGDAPILAMVEEAQPLLKLFGTFDVRPMLVRLGFLPFAAVLLIPFLMKNERGMTKDERETSEVSRSAFRFIAVWVAITLALALLHSRFTFSAAIALSAFAGVAIEDRLGKWNRSIVVLGSLLLLAPTLSAYTGGPRYNLFTRGNALSEYEMDRICVGLRRAPAGAVLAPWQFGHWIVALAEKPVVLSPMLSVGQSEFAAGERFFFLEDDRVARAFLDTHGVRYVIVTPETGSIEPRARVAGIDPSRYLRAGRIDPATYMRTIGARLTYAQTVPGYREVDRSRTFVPGPFGPLPLVRVYEVVR